jgi:hypothetical protein
MVDEDIMRRQSLEKLAIRLAGRQQGTFYSIAEKQQLASSTEHQVREMVFGFSRKTKSAGL